MGHLFHITTRKAWDRAQGTGHYRPKSLDTEGFIHLSTEQQWRHTLHRLFRGQKDLVVLCIDTDRLAGEVRFEPADGEEFPHLYAPLEVSAVVHVREAPRIVPPPEGFVAKLLAADEAIEDVIICEVTARGRAMTCVVLAPKKGREGQISLATVMMIAAPAYQDAGWMQLHSLPRLADGALDDVAVLSYVETLVEEVD